MRFLTRSLLWILLLLPLAWLTLQILHPRPHGMRLPNGASMEWGECWFETPLLRPVHCGRFRTGGEGPGFSLPVVYIPAWAWERGPSPLLYVAGGPGGANWLDAAGMPGWFDWFEHTDLGRDLVLYDQRGVGLSEPTVGCPEMHATSRELLPQALSAGEAAAAIHDAMYACHERLRAEGVDLEAFTTRHNARDALDLMAAMGLRRWAVYGVSYGTRVALEMQRQDPAALEAVILDSVYPPQVNPELADPWLLDRALTLFSRICGMASTCEHTPAELATLLEQSMERLRLRPLQLSVPDPENGGELVVRYTADDLAWLVFEALYQTPRIPALPAAIDALSRGEVAPALRAMVADSVATILDDGLSLAVSHSVDCHDAAPVSAGEAAAQLLRYPRVAALLAHDWQYGPCRFWESGDAGAEFRRAVVSDVPNLLLAGEFDPVTPPQWSDLAAQSLGNALGFTFGGVGHGVLDAHACAADLTRAFLRNPQQPEVPDCVVAD